MISYYLYKIENLVNGKLYIGITTKPETRKAQHLRWKKPTKLVSLIKQAVVKYGAENFMFTVLCQGSKDYIIDLEKKAIEHYKTLTPDGYNIRKGGDDCGVGHKIRSRSDDKPFYLKGFWFPSLRVCSEKLAVTKTTVQRWRKSKEHGDECVSNKMRSNTRDVWCYVGGFWFPTLSKASEILVVARKTLLKRIKDGFIEQQSRSKDQGRKSDGTFSMTGRTGFSHPNSRPVFVEGQLFGSITQAALNTNYTKKMIYTKIKNKTEGFYYAENP